MHHCIKKYIFLCIWVCSAGSVQSRSTAPVLTPYIESIKQLSRNCTIDYAATCIYPDKTSQVVNGRMAICGKNYYDSSNVRFVLMNSKWLLFAEHGPKMLSVIYLPDWKQKMGKEYELDISGYLLSNAEEGNFNAFNIRPGNKDSFSVSIRYEAEGQNIDLLLFYVAGSKMPWRYEGNIHYVHPKDEVGKIPVEYMSVHFACSNIQTPTDAGLFNEERIIQYTGPRQAHMRRFNDYKIYRKRG